MCHVYKPSETEIQKEETFSALSNKSFLLSEEWLADRLKYFQNPEADMQIRAATKEDAGAISKLLHALWPKRLTAEAYERAFITFMERPDTAALVAFVDASIVGLAAWFTTFNLQGGNTVAYLEALMVDEEHRGSGIGTELLEAFENTCGADEVRLHSSFRRERAHEFYTRQEYQKTSFLFWKEN